MLQMTNLNACVSPA